MKDCAVQYMRVSAMIFIVLYHCVCFYGIWHIQDSVKYDNIEYWRSACYFALNAFVFISGLLYAKLYSAKEKYRNRKGLLKDKVNRLLFPYFFWSMVALLLFPSTEPLKVLICGSHHLWFLLMLMGVFLMISIMGDKVLSVKILAGGGIYFVNTQWISRQIWQFNTGIFGMERDSEIFTGVLCRRFDCKTEYSESFQTTA